MGSCSGPALVGRRGGPGCRGGGQGRPGVTATYDGRPGHPKLFDRRLLPDLLRLTGDTGARDLLAADPERVHRVEVGDLGSDADIDVEADLERVGAMLTNRRKP